jgi:hypothetical protein
MAEWKESRHYSIEHATSAMKAAEFLRSMAGIVGVSVELFTNKAL